MDFPRTHRKRIEISLIPLIDVSMFLLIFFMVAGSIEKFEIIPIDPPVAQSGKLMDEGHVEVLLGSHDEIIVDDEIVPMEEMQKRLALQLEANPNRVVTVRADATVPANRMIELMDAIKAAGGRNLSVVTQSKAQVHVE
ncbi:MAG: biopolymer transporter ExbD [Pseudomonadota bacterium]|nr:biopolymer transporter ExbD [Pseudomonadota bacterium]